LEWWTFAGLLANQTIIQFLQPYFSSPLRADNFWINLPSDESTEHLVQTIQKLRSIDTPPNWDVQQTAADLIKFGDLLPANLLHDMIMTRIADIPSARKILHSPIRVITD
jgi:hypothetical protein